MSYAQFLCSFIGIPLIILVIYFIHCNKKNKSSNFKAILILCALAVIYTTPWDNYLVAQNIWWYGKNRVIGIIGYVPIEEYCFFVLQSLMTGLFCFFLMSQIKIVNKPYENRYAIYIILLLLTTFFCFSLYCLTKNSLFYLGLILSWSIPILILQFFVGGKYLLQNTKLLFWSTLLPSFYLWFADSYAIQDGIWSISKIYTTGIKIFALPMEEAVFFLMTNIMLVQGLILFNVMRSRCNGLRHF